MGNLNKKLSTKEVVSFLLIGIGVIAFMAAFSSGDKEPSPASAASIKPQKPLVEQREAFVTLLQQFDADKAIVGVAEGFSPHQLAITVPNDWHYQPQQIRIQMGQNFWKIWASIHSPDKPDQARISIRDLNGNEVGGSRVMAGSLIWMKEN